MGGYVTRYVDSTRPNDLGDGATWDSAFQTLQRAARFSPASVGADGFIVEVKDNGWTAPYTFTTGTATGVTLAFSGTATYPYLWNFNGAVIDQSVSLASATWTRVPGYVNVYSTPIAATISTMMFRGGGYWWDTAQKIPVPGYSLTSTYQIPTDYQWFHFFNDTVNSLLYICVPDGNPADSGIIPSYSNANQYGLLTGTKNYHEFHGGIIVGGYFAFDLQSHTNKIFECWMAHQMKAAVTFNADSADGTHNCLVAYNKFLTLTGTANGEHINCYSNYGSEVYNNIFVSNSYAIYYSGSATTPSPKYIVKNNVFVDQKLAAFGYSAATKKAAFTEDYNVFGGSLGGMIDWMPKVRPSSTDQSIAESYTFGSNSVYNLPSVDYLMIGNEDAAPTIKTDYTANLPSGPINLGAVTDGTAVYIGLKRQVGSIAGSAQNNYLYFHLTTTSTDYTATWEYAWWDYTHHCIAWEPLTVTGTYGNTFPSSADVVVYFARPTSETKSWSRVYLNGHFAYWIRCKTGLTGSPTVAVATTVGRIRSNTNLLLTDVTYANYKPLPSSPLIGAGADVGLTTDFSGVTIKGLPEIGIYEFAAAPTVTTQAVGDIGVNTATGNGTLTADGDGIITELGVCWSTSANPTLADDSVASTSLSGAFTADITGLIAETTYYVAAYATNEAGTSYGADVTFETLAEPVVAPTVTTGPVSIVISVSVHASGEVTDNGGGLITERGFVWSTTAHPTTADDKLVVEGRTGTFTGVLTGLSPDTHYYMAAYATNDEGTVYGDDVEFDTTLDPLTIYVRMDGEAADRVSATGPSTDKTKCISPTTHNAAAFSPGDTILLSDKGGVLGPIVPPSSGEVGNVITYQAVTGEAPIIDLRIEVSDWVGPDGNGVYTKANSRTEFFMDDDTILAKDTVNTVIPDAGKWYQDGTDSGTLYYQPAVAIGTTYRVSNANRIGVGIYLNDKKYISIKGIQFQYCYSGVWGYNENTGATRNIIIDDCIFKWCYNGVIFHTYTDKGDLPYVSFTNNQSYNCAIGCNGTCYPQ